MATVLARQGYPTRMLVRRQEVVDGINQQHRNPTCAPNGFFSGGWGSKKNSADTSVTLSFRTT
jgi:glycerol-3-phosphate dehydrogenase